MSGGSLEVLRKRAKEAIRHGQNQQALEIYQKVLLSHDDNPELHYGIATVYFLLGDLPSAAEHFKTVIHLDPERANAHINLGAVFQRMGEYEESLACLKQGIDLDSERPEGHYNLALAYKHLGELDLALGAYREAVRLDPKLYEAHLNMGNIFREKHQYSMALVHYRSALELRPTCAKAKSAVQALEAEATHGENGTAGKPASEPAAPLDIDRHVDPIKQGHALRDLHQQIVDLDSCSQAMLTFLHKELEAAIRQLSISMLTPDDPQHDLDGCLRRFDEMVIKLHTVHEILQKSFLRTKGLGEEIMKT